MTRPMWVVLMGGLLVAAVSAQEQIPPSKKSKPAPPPQTDKERAGYVIGLDTGRRLQSQGLEVDLSFLMNGIRDSLSGSRPALSDKEIQETIAAIQKIVDQNRARVTKEMAKKNKEDGERFLAANAKKEGIKTTKSGLQYKVLKEGMGSIPKPTDMVKTHYHGTFISGEVFDSSVRRGEPEVFPVNRVIPGWTEALQLMKVGSKWQLFVPSDLAYGEEGSGDIPPNATLIFEVELLAIEKQASRSE